ncbi:MAG: hypothetical protein ACHQD9_06180 [Chitinophagales bacterium]
MKQLKFSLLMVLLMSATLSRAQEELPKNFTWKDSARILIRNLKDGALIVRLQSRSMAISKLNELGNYSGANEIKSQQREENLEVVEAFRSSFSFCKVYFFFTDSTDALLSGKRTGYFLDDSLKVDPSISLKEIFFMIAEVGNPHRQIK